MKKLTVKDKVSLAGVILISAFLSFFVAMMVSCTKVDVNEVSADAPKVEITPSVAMPGNMLYYFYSTAGEELIMKEALPDGSLNETVAAGTYHVLAVENNRNDYRLKGMENIDNATVCLLEIDGQEISEGTTKTLCSQPGEIRVLYLGEVTVSEKNTTVYMADPIVLTQKMVFAFDLEQVSKKVVRISGTVNGVYPSVYLKGAVPAEESQAPHTYLCFEGTPVITGNGAGKANVSVYSFGMRQPMSEDQEIYNVQVEVTLDFDDGTAWSTVVDITQQLSRLMNENSNLPENTVIMIPIEVNP